VIMDEPTAALGVRETEHVLDLIKRIRSAWTDEIDQMLSVSLFDQADSWYVGANIPGKKRSLGVPRSAIGVARRMS
jgi:hypothetical protein